MDRKVTLSTPKQVDEYTQITGATLDYCYFKNDLLVVYMNGGKLSEGIPLDGLSDSDRLSVESFVAMLCRVTGAEISTGTAKEAARAKEEARRTEAENERKVDLEIEKVR